LTRAGTFLREYEADIRTFADLRSALDETRPDAVFHLAAQSLVRLSYLRPLDTLQTNVSGTANLLQAVVELGLPCNLVIVTSDKCYENREWVHGLPGNRILWAGTTSTP